MNNTNVAIFIDGCYFENASNYYLNSKNFDSKIKFQGLIQYILNQISEKENTRLKNCVVQDAHFFKGVLPACDEKTDYAALHYQAKLDEILRNANITSHYQTLVQKSNGCFHEKGVDVSLALTAFEIGLLKKPDYVVLVAGDNDFTPLILKLNSLGIKTMLIGWNITDEIDGDTYRIRTSKYLQNAATYFIEMHQQILSLSQQTAVDFLFTEKLKQDQIHEPISINQVSSEEILYKINNTDLQVRHTQLFTLIDEQPNYVYQGIIHKISKNEGSVKIKFYHNAIRFVNNDIMLNLNDIKVGTKVSFKLRTNKRRKVIFATNVTLLN